MDASYLSFLRTNDFRCVFRYYYGVNANTAVQFHIASKCTKLPTYQVRQKPFHAKLQNCLTHGNISVIMNLFSIEIVYLFPEVTVGVVK